jgi:hypothetical protein
MKPSEFKKMIKEAVKEAIQEELREIILEAVRTPKGTPVGVGGYGNVNESIAYDTYAQPHISQPKQLTAEERKNMFSQMLGEMQTGGVANTAYAGNVQLSGPVDTINGALPEGQVGLDQIMSMMNK